MWMVFRLLFLLIVMVMLTTALSAAPIVLDPAMPSLKKNYAPYFLIGTALGGMLPGAYSAREIALITSQFDVITPENCMKPRAIQPREGKFNFETADALLAFAEGHGLQVTGHCLLWHTSCPDWFFRDGDHPASRALVLARMRTHIHTLVGRYRGRVKGWDVVNEAIDDGNAYLRKTSWSTLVGEDFIAKAFEFAHEADPRAELYYNDYGIEAPVKREKALRLIRELQGKGLRIDAVGIQGHWELDAVPFAEIEEAITAFHQAGVKVMITELDLDILRRPSHGANVAQTAPVLKDLYPDGCPPELLARQAEQYGRLFRLLRTHADAVTRVTFWGLHDGRSWLNSWPARRTNYPLLFDRDCAPKPAFTATIQAATP